eukprot:3018188-Pyramimonas_sp.AAC.2
MSIGNATFNEANHRSDSEVCGSPAVGSPPRTTPVRQHAVASHQPLPPTHSEFCDPLRSLAIPEA